MSDQTKPQMFFLGANSPKGFVSLFEQLDPQNGPWHTFIIKGGPGTGKSSFLKRIAAYFGPQCPNMEVIPCSSDPDSLDAVILPEYRVALADGTAPHVLEPDAPALRPVQPHGEIPRPVSAGGGSGGAVRRHGALCPHPTDGIWPRPLPGGAHQRPGVYAGSPAQTVAGPPPLSHWGL